MATVQQNTLILVWLCVLPFFVAGCAALFPRLSIRFHSEAERVAMAWAPFSLAALACIMGVGLTASLLPPALAGNPVIADYWWTQDLYHFRLQGDALSLLAVFAVYALGFPLHLHLVGLREAGPAATDRGPIDHTGAHRAALILAAQGCAIAALLSADLIVLVFSVQVALICLWGLVSITMPQRGLRFLLLAQVCGLLLLGGALLMWRQVGDTSIQALPLLLLSMNPSVLRLVSVLILLGLLPLISGAPAYGWLSSLLPLKRSIPMAPATLLVIMGTALMLRLLPGVLLLPGLPTFAALCLVLGLFSLWWGGLRAWIATDMGAFAAWLTVAQSGYVLVALAAASSPNAPPAVLQAAAMQIFLAPLAALTIWSVASYVATRTGSDALPGISGMIKTMPLAGVALLAGGLSLAGVPPLAGFHVQRLLIGGLFADARPALGVVVILADLLLVAAVLGVFRQAFLRGEPPPPAAPASPWLSGQLALLTVGIALIGLWPGPLIHWTEVIFRTALSVTP